MGHVSFYVERNRLQNTSFQLFKGKYCFWTATMPSELSTWIVNSSDRFIISFILGLYMLDITHQLIYLEIISYLQYYSNFLILPPFLAKRYDENKLKDVSNILEHSLKYFLFIGILLH
jgi:O-antigen/teichoic acid export membrane protein